MWNLFSEIKKFCQRFQKYSTTERLYTQVVTPLLAGSLVMSFSNNQKETFKGSGRQDLYFEIAQITKRKLSRVKLPFLAQPHS